MKTNQNIILIGFMGTGKTAVGKLLARKLHRRFIELDRLIEKREKKSIPQIFSQKGEAYFRKVERKLLRNTTSMKKIVLATGGGMVLNPLNVRDLKKNGILVCLTASLGEIARRTSLNRNRPLLQNKNRFQTIKKLLKFRRPLYRKAADFFVNSSDKNARQTAALIMNRLEKK